MYLTDYHCHSILSFDGQAPLSVMAERALEAGIRELCITDHCDLLDADARRVYTCDWAPALEQYHREAERFAGRLELKLGLEFGMGHIDPPAARAILDQPELDFVIGSVHNLSPGRGGTDLYHLDYSTPESCYAALDDYFESMELLVDSPFYDVLGHVIYPLRYMHGMVTVEPYLDRIEAILRRVARDGKGMEVNTCRGLTVEDWRPVLERYRAAGGRIVTVGSDAHNPDHAGAGVEAAFLLLREMGFGQVAVYRRREPEFIDI